MSSLPAHARPYHEIQTPRLLIRSCVVSDALQINTLFTEPRNNPFDGVVDPDAPVSAQEQKLEAQRLSTARGENAWMVVIRKDATPPAPAPDSSVERLVVKEGLVIGQTGFNAFPLQPSLTDPTREVLVADLGVLIDYRFAREGYATETLSALIEYGFGELGVGMITLETQAVNQPMRNVLRTMGLGDGTIRGHGSEAEAVYLFERGTWEEAKKEMKLKGKWYLA